jgi:hypothetical protein
MKQMTSRILLVACFLLVPCCFQPWHMYVLKVTLLDTVICETETATYRLGYFCLDE